MGGVGSFYRILRRELPYLGLAAGAVVCVTLLALGTDDPRSSQPAAIMHRPAGGGSLRLQVVDEDEALEWSGRETTVGSHLQLFWTHERHGQLAVLAHVPGDMVVMFSDGERWSRAVDSGSDVELGEAMATASPWQLLELWAFFADQPFRIEAIARFVKGGRVPEPREFPGEVVRLQAAKY